MRHSTPIPFALLALGTLFVICPAHSRVSGSLTNKGSLEVTQSASQTSAGEGSACSPESWHPPVNTGGTGVQALLKTVPISTTWADLPATTKDQLQRLADDRLAAFRARWSAGALAKKQEILLGCPTPEMAAATDDFYQKGYDAVVPATFSLGSLRSSSLRRALVDNYLGTIAASRAGLTYPSGKLPNRDWDGKSHFDSVSLPDQRTYDDIRAYNAKVVQELRNLEDASLDGFERALKQHVLFDARANAAGGASYGDGDMESACHIVGLDSAVLAGYERDKGRPKIFGSDDEVLREINAIYLNNMDLKWLDVGTFNSALNYCNTPGLRNQAASLVGDPSTNETAKGMVLLKNWWVERTRANKGSHNKCTVYSAADRARIWEAFSASQLFNNDGSSPMEADRARLDTYVNQNRAHYRELAKLALKRVFPDDAVLTPSQRRKVVGAIKAENAFGALPEKVERAIDAAQGTTGGKAAAQWKEALKRSITRVGGNYGQSDTIRPGDRLALEAMFEEVKAWVAHEHAGYPVDIAALYPHIGFVIDAHSDTADTVPPGKITIGIGTGRSKLEYYSWMIHELRHAVLYARQATVPDKSKVKDDEGFVKEGSGIAAEALLLAPFAKATVEGDTALTLYLLDYGIRDARFAGTTDATLQRYFRAGCAGPSDPDTIGFTRNIAAAYGLTGQKADTVALRSHAGTQYLQYIIDGMRMLDAIAYLQGQIDPTGRRRVDPYVLFACGLNAPSREEPYVTALKSCMELDTSEGPH